MPSVSLKLVLAAPLLFLFTAQNLRPVAGQASPAPTPCKGATNTTNKIKDSFIFQGGLSQPLDPGLARTLPFENEKSSAWGNSSLVNIPIDCEVAANGKCSLDNMQVYDALYDQSCSVPWTMCRCTLAEMSETDTRDPFGMIGSKLRSYVRHVMAFPSPLDAWTENQDIIFYGYAGNVTILSNFIHQATHAMDAGLGNFSAQTNWTVAVDTDSCVADQAATMSYSEAFAQAMVVHMYAVLNNTLTLNTSCMSNQLDVLQTVFPHDVLFPKNCDLSVKPPASKTVAKVPNNGNIRSSSSSAVTSQTNVNFATAQTGVHGAAIAGIAIGSFIIGVVTFVAFLFWRHYRIAQAKMQDATPRPKAEGSSGGATQVAHDNGSIIVIESPSPGPQKDEMYQTPLTREDQTSDAHAPDEQPQQTSPPDLQS